MTLEEFQFLYSLSSPETIRGPQVALALDELVRDDRSLSMIRVSPDHGPVSGEAHDLARDIRASPSSGGLDTKVTGVTPDLQDTVARMYSNFPKMIIYVSVVTYLALFFSVPLRRTAIEGGGPQHPEHPCQLGALVFVFQQGHFQSLLGFTSQGITEASVPILLFSIVLGLSMDYEVFLLSRVKE